MIDENKLIQTIVAGSDWQEVLTNIVVEEGMDPAVVDIIKLTDSFMFYLKRLKTFDFRVPARFVLIAAILLRMKCELLLEEEEPKEEIKGESPPPINIEDIPSLSPPLERKPTRKVTLTELVSALNKAFEFKERKETKKLRMRRRVEGLIEPEEDIEIRIKNVFDQILRHGTFMKFSDIVPVWKRKEIVEIFLPLLHLSNRGKVVCEQEEFFKDITVRVV
ncbi:MAG: segregation/condensation protein A [Candidatus Aenigmarchaeota archaeon]|nr:segregation/condensation protein A [Candidatus Aenigmarchaeota archaeon]